MVTFPALGLNLEINKIAIKIFGIDIYWYAILIVMAIIIGIAFLKKNDKIYGIDFDDMTQLMIIAIPVSVIFARLYYVIFNFDYYSENISQIFSLRLKGLAIYGGIFGAVISTIIFCKIKKLDILDVMDYVIPYIALRTSNR